MSMTHQRADLTLASTLGGGTSPHIWLHVGNPSVTGTENVAQLAGASIVRKICAFSSPENHPLNTERRVLSLGTVAWSGAEISAGQTITHMSLWNAATGGMPEFISLVTEPKMVGSDGVVITPGDVEVALSIFVRP